MARRKLARKHSPKRKKTHATPKRRRARHHSNPIGRIMKRRSSSPGSGSYMNIATEIGGVGVGLIGGQYLGKILAEKVEALADGKIRGAGMLVLGIVGAKMLPKAFRAVAVGIGASGAYQLVKELAPDVIAGDVMGALSPADVELIENMALESEVTGFDQELNDTVNGGMDREIIDTVTGADDDDDDEASY